MLSLSKTSLQPRQLLCAVSCWNCYAKQSPLGIWKVGSSFTVLYFWTRHQSFLDLTLLTCKTESYLKREGHILLIFCPFGCSGVGQIGMQGGRQDGLFAAFLILWSWNRALTRQVYHNAQQYFSFYFKNRTGHAKFSWLIIYLERVGLDRMGGRLRVLLSGSGIDVRIQASFTFQRLDPTVA